MNPKTYSTLYGPWQPSPAPHRRRTAVAVMAGVLWALTLVSLAWLAFLVSMTTVWGLAAGVSAGGLFLRYVLIVAGSAAALIALAFAPGVRRLTAESRLLLAGVLAFPVPAILAITTWIQTG
ncbi:hypothetical protein ACFT9I_18890 [Streptomyces sp. NPDC057137]|uniref:hypothetical protein n=1 Tax=Streptomyces sp. NPDC057137 TaxID=3346030 RepID=UPI0036399581